jgi:tRNA G18 (ribose-2'-O)-methylase SpoU
VVTIGVVQLDHYDTLRKMPSADTDCLLCVCGITSENFGLLLRSASVFGIKAIYYYGDMVATGKQFQKISRSATIQVYSIDSINSLMQLKTQGYEIVALEVTDDSIPLSKLSFKHKTCLVVGNERHGVPQEILDIADAVCHIEMIGKQISSLNVAVATSIALYKMVEMII